MCSCNLTLTLLHGFCRGVSPGDYGPNGGAAFDNLMMQLMEAHQPQASPTSRDTLSALPRRKVRSASTAGTPSDVFSNTPTDLRAACACGEPCSVCHDPMEEHTEVLELPCQHCYHEDCITSWLKDVGNAKPMQCCAVSPRCCGLSRVRCLPVPEFAVLL